MRKKFKKRLLGIILTILMVVSVIPVQQVQPVKAAGTLTLNKGDKIYFKVISRDNGTFGEANAVPAVYLKTSATDGSGTWQTMTEVPGESNIYQYVVDIDSVTHVAFRRTSPDGRDWNSMTKPLEISGNGNMYTSAGWNNASKENYNPENWCTYSGGGETPKTTGTYYAKADLVDYFNDSRIDEGKTNNYSSNNQGNTMGDKNEGHGVAFSYFNSIISNQYREKKETIPLYVGSLLFTNNRVGRSTIEGKEYAPLSRWNSTANVALAYPNQGGKENLNLDASVQGLVQKTLGTGGALLGLDGTELPFFSKEFAKSDYAKIGNQPVMQYFSDYQFPFTESTENSVTTYSYDSAKDKAVYINWDNLDNKKLIQSDTHIFNNDGSKGYYPFNKEKDTDNKANRNFGFGTKFTIPFTINDNGTINGQEDGKPITFDFTGDDDVWVFLDGKLILDMGGAHAKATGSIDFKDLKATVDNAAKASTGAEQMSNIASNASGADYQNAGLTNYVWTGDKAQERSTVSSTKEILDFNKEYGKDYADTFKDPSKVHTLTMFYMERGMHDSNMKIQFTINPLPSGLSVSKQVDTKNVNKGLQTAAANKDTFEFIMRKGASEEDLENVSGVNYSFYDGKTTHDKKVEADGKIKLKDKQYADSFENTDGTDAFKPGDYFNITEKLNNNYTTKWFVTDLDKKTEELDKPVEKGEGNVAEFSFGEHVDEFSKANYNVNFVNTPKVGTVNITKAWDGDVPDTLKNTEFPFKVEVDLDGEADEYGYLTYPLEYTVDRNDYVTDANGNFTLKSGQTAAFAGIPKGATVKVTETTTEGNSWEVSGSNEAVSQPVTETTNETLKITNATKTKTLNKVIYVETGKETLYKPAEVETGYTVNCISKDLTYSENGFNGKEPGQSYTATYTGSNSDGAIVNGTITVLTYKATDKVYVFDYGLESNIAATNKNEDGLFQGGTFYNANATGDMDTTAKLGTITYVPDDTQTPQTTITGSGIEINKNGSANGAVTFKPIAFMDKVENYNYTANIAKVDTTFDDTNPETGTTVNGTIKTMPANVVYYEDDFNAGSETTDGTTKIVYTGTNSSKEGTPPAVKLTQSNGQTEQYGYDDAYTKGTGDSNGTSRKMTDGAKATFTFTGTGFDVIARTTSNTAGITYIVSKKVGESWTAVSVGAVDTYYANGDLYQIPVIHKDLGEKNTYKVTLRATESTVANVIYLDGIRIYNPLGTEDNEKYIDNEKGATFVKVSDLVLGNGKVTETGIDGAITNQVIDGSKAAILGYAEGEEEGKALSALGYTIVEDNTNGSAGSTNSNSILQYLQAGPNNEVYLDETAAVAFVATADSAVTNKTIQVEAKLADLGQHEGNKPEPSKGMELRVIGADGTANVVANVTSSTAMYYSIDLTKCIDLGDNKYLVVIVGNSDYEPDEDYESGGTHCISFTNIKYKGYEFSSPYENDAAKKYIDMTVFEADRTKFASIDFPSVHKNVWSNYKCSVTLNENVFGDAAPKFKLYYKNINGELKPISVTAKRTREDSNKYELRFRAPNALGNFAVELHYVVKGEESTDYIATTMTVKR